MDKWLAISEIVRNFALAWLLIACAAGILRITDDEGK